MRILSLNEMYLFNLSQDLKDFLDSFELIVEKKLKDKNVTVEISKNYDEGILKGSLINYDELIFTLKSEHFKVNVEFYALATKVVRVTFYATFNDGEKEVLENLNDAAEIQLEDFFSDEKFNQLCNFLKTEDLVSTY